MKLMKICMLAAFLGAFFLAGPALAFRADQCRIPQVQQGTGDYIIFGTAPQFGGGADQIKDESQRAPAESDRIKDLVELYRYYGITPRSGKFPMLPSDPRMDIAGNTGQTVSYPLP